jgi:hypothetical protein
MKKLNLIMVLMCFAMTSAMFGQTITGIVNTEDGPLPGANIVEKRTTNGTTTDFDGKFSLNVAEGSGTIIISFIGYSAKEISYTLASGETKDLGTITLTSDNTLEEVVIVGVGVIDLAEGRSTPIAVSTVKAAEIQAKSAGNVEFTETMKHMPSVFVSAQAGGFGDSQIFLRGFNDSNTAFLLNGQPINSVEDGRMFWSNWAGMADVANAIQVQRGLGSSKLAISSVGGTVNIISRTTDRKRGGFARFLIGNDSFVKSTVSYNTGSSDKGWSFSFLVDHWQGHRKYSIGTAGQGQNYLFSVGYKPNDKNTFNFLITGAPQWHDQNFSDSLERYQEFGNKLNDNTGFLNGERYTERRNYYHKPVANLNWDFDISENLDLSTVLYGSWGRGGGTGGLGRGRVRNEDIGITGPNQREIAFDQIVTNNIATSNSSGFGNNNDSYIRRASVNNHNWYGLLSSLNIKASENWKINIGFDSRIYHGDHFRQVNDLLGLNGYTDNFRTNRPDDYTFTNEFEADPWQALFDFAGEADRTQYDYSEDINYLGGFGQAEYSTDKFSVFFQGALSTQSFQREGRFVGRGNGLGKSKKLNKTGYNIKGGFSYNLAEKHKVFTNAGFFSRQPFLDNIFADIRNSNDLVEPDVDNEEITGFEAGYRFNNGNFRLNIDLYYTKWANRFLAFGGEIDDPSDPNFEDNTTTRMTNVTQVHKGIEFDFEYRPEGDKWNLRGYGSYGDWMFDGSTPFTVQNDETGDFINSNGNADLTGTYVGNAPQVSFGVNLFINLLDNLSIDGDYNVHTKLFGFVDPENVAESALAGEVFQAEKLPTNNLVDAGITYKFKLGENRLTFRGNVKNVFNWQRVNQRDRFGYRHAIGRTFNASLRYSF